MVPHFLLEIKFGRSSASHGHDYAGSREIPIGGQTQIFLNRRRVVFPAEVRSVVLTLNFGVWVLRRCTPEVVGDGEPFDPVLDLIRACELPVAFRDLFVATFRTEDADIFVEGGRGVGCWGWGGGGGGGGGEN